MNVWIPATDALDLCKAILTLFRDVGARGDRQKARLMWLIEENGLDVFKSMVGQEMAKYKKKESYEFVEAQKHSQEWNGGECE
jgi:ferredoxin-nitrite reductase